jgi:hypothetical protein
MKMIPSFLAFVLAIMALAACNRPISPATAVPDNDAAGSASPTVAVTITVYFTDMARYARGEEPYETAVTRLAPADAHLPTAVLTEFFKGPTPEEQEQHLEAITSGFTGFARLDISPDGVAHIYLTGECAPLGATYTIAQPILTNLLQFDPIQTVKIYDTDGTTSNPEGVSHSIPTCLEP